MHQGTVKERRGHGVDEKGKACEISTARTLLFSQFIDWEDDKTEARIIVILS